VLLNRRNARLLRWRQEESIRQPLGYGTTVVGIGEYGDVAGFAACLSRRLTAV